MIRVRPSQVSGTVRSAPSKSCTHRAVVLASLAKGESVLRRPLVSEDTKATIAGMAALGAQIAVGDDAATVRGSQLKAPKEPIDCLNSGTTLRLLSGIASLLDEPVTLTGDASLQSRPMKPLLAALTELGVKATSQRSDGRAPITVQGPNTGRWAHIKGDVSSQFISSLLISSALKPRDTDVVITTPLISRPYVDLTISMMASFGVKCAALKNGYRVMGGQSYRPLDYAVPGDWSSAAFMLAAGALAGKVAVKGLDKETAQGDRRFLDVLEGFGAKPAWTEDSVKVAKADLDGADVDMGDIPDLFPITAVLATQARGRTVLSGAGHLRFKESDRIATTASMLKGMGADITPTDDGCIVNGPTKLTGGAVGGADDHRIFMAAAIAGLVSERPVELSGRSYEVSYPRFLDDLRRIGAGLEASG